MRTLQDIENLLSELDHVQADNLEDQDLDFKQWNTRSMADAVNLVVRMAVCMANGGGGTVVFGVADKVKGRLGALLGVPPEVDVNRLKKAVYDQTDPKITPVFEDLRILEGTGCLLVMQIYPGMPPYTDTSGLGSIRIGKDCQPLTGTLRRKIAVETGESDFTAESLPGPIEGTLSPAAMEKLRTLARKERAADDLLRLPDHDLLGGLGLIRDGRLTRAGLLIAGSDAALEHNLQSFCWTWLKMESDTRYSNRIDGHSAMPVAFARLEELINADNPITTLEQGLFHLEYRIYPEIALREALLNAFCHADFRMAGPIMVKQHTDRLEISNNGGFIGGITPDNILHHQPVARNPLLVEALTRLRLVNRSNLGIGRMYESLLIEGKEPPIICEIGESVAVTFLRRDISPVFRLFAAEESQAGRGLSVDRLLILLYLLKHPEIDTAVAAKLCQRTEAQGRELLSNMEQLEYLERGGTGRGTYWSIRSDLYHRLAGPGTPERTRRIDWEAAKTRVLSVLKERSHRGEPGLGNEEIRRITHYDRFQVIRLMKELMHENPEIAKPGQGRNARYCFMAS